MGDTSIIILCAARIKTYQNTKRDVYVDIELRKIVTSLMAHISSHLGIVV
tara:strand:+ start:275 stop:424 length:150 start_codon:yes stop_codon:yes gene_type:complete